ncbi:SPRY domain-containing SOCS box protein 3-like [Hylaeus anthracinus]|uniref:SPRY domain-containing SOCS box protein 3-like n=1 Tax=Hylaeus anthracinus TaxID=313031 RepID=UPI0023B9CC41|nr:SPRY domain-containing SOCS box protein 3-like [Hylaeus anthracinus]
MNVEHDLRRFVQYESFCNCKPQDCRCGENDATHEWTWDEKLATHTVALSGKNLEVMFHSGYSSGTAGVRGTKPLEKGKLHYWELKMLTPVYGTDIMVGVGTSKVDLNGKSDTFCSLLGLDKESYGFSYQGYVQHGDEKRKYGCCFGQGSLVGIYLNTWRGTLEFFVNREPLGIAFTGLQDVMLYPMVSSTAAQSMMRLTHACSIPVSLQTECLAVLKSPQREYLATMFPGLRYLSGNIIADILKSKLKDEDKEKDDLKSRTDHMILDDYDYALVGISRRKRKRI